MGKPYSMDLRQRIILAHDQGQTRREIAGRFEMSLSTVGRYIRLKRTVGSVAPGKFGGHKRYALADHEALIRGWIDECPHMTLQEIRSRLKEDQKVSVSLGATFNFLRYRGLPYKKNSACR